jgi:hypothetical protein
MLCFLTLSIILFLFKTLRFGECTNILLQVKPTHLGPIDIVPISGYQNEHKTNVETEHKYKPSPGVKTKY